MIATRCPVKNVSEVALWVRDLDKTIAFYRDNLCFVVESINPGRHATLRCDNSDFKLVLFVPGDPVSPAESEEEFLMRTGAPRGQVYHVAFHVDRECLDALATKLCEEGVEVRGPIDFQSGRRSFFLEDPDDHYIELSDR